jgi:DNA-binding Lrp family transcriptional regulator
LVQPDILDRRILRELESPLSLQWNVRESLSSIAKKVHVDEETVRRRVDIMRKAGILIGWQLILNPHLIGRESASLELEVKNGSPKKKILEQIRLLDGVISILDLQGQNIQVGIYYRNELMLEKQIALMESLCDCKHSMFWKVVFPTYGVKMTTTDWRLLNILRKDPRRKIGEIAAEAKISTKTVTRRLNMMVERYAFFLHALINLKKVGGLGYRLLIQTSDSEKKAEIDETILKRVEENLEWSFTFSDEYSMFVFYCENSAEAKEISESVGKLDGVNTFRMDIIEEQITIQDWIDEEIALKISDKSEEPKDEQGSKDA